MNFPSTEFSDTVTRLCFGTARVGEAAGLHALLRSDQAARDEYLWQVELHARLAQLAAAPNVESALSNAKREPGNRQFTPARANRRFQWELVAALLAIVFGGAFWVIRHSGKSQKNNAAVDPRQAPSTAPLARNTSIDGDGASGASHAAGVYRATVRFAIAADAPVIAGTGRSEPIELGAEVPYIPGGDTLHVWDWSKSTRSRVFKDTRLWPEDVFAVSPDGKTLVLAHGKIIDLATGEPSKIDLGGGYYHDNTGGHLQRIQKLQFTPDGRHLALLLSNIVLTKSSHPLRKHDFGSMRTVQIVTWPAGELVCEFPAGLTVAFSPDGKRAVTGIPELEPMQQVIEHSATTGEVIRKYEPRLREFAYHIVLSPDVGRLAVYDTVGEVLIWDSTTGELKHRVKVTESSPMDLRFSPDGKLLAISPIKMTRVIDVASGAVVAAVPQEIPGLIRWSSDSRAFDLISNVTNGTMTERNDNSGRMTVYNMFPALKRWNIEDFRKK